MATALGYRYLVRFYEGTATLVQLDACLTKGWITLDEYDRAVEGLAPLGYGTSALSASSE